MSERLFRDEQGAAIERVARLEDENRRLREELDRLRDGRPPTEERRPPTSSPLPAAVAALVAGMLMLGGLLTTFHHGPPRRPRPPRFASAVLPPAQPMLTHDADCTDPFYTDTDGTLRVKTQCSPDPAPSADCTTPFYLDARGIRHYKRSCVFGH